MPSTRTFSDVNFNLERHPATNDVLRVYDLEAIKAAVKHLVLTEFYGRPFHPEVGSAIAGILFENWGQLTKKAIEVSIRAVIDNHEPRATVEKVDASFDEASNTIRATVTFFANALMQEAQVDLILQRLR